MYSPLHVLSTFLHLQMITQNAHVQSPACFINILAPTNVHPECTCTVTCMTFLSTFWHLQVEIQDTQYPACFSMYIYILVKSSNLPHAFLPIFGKAIRTISISFAFPELASLSAIHNRKRLSKTPYSLVENQNDLELDFKVFFFGDSCY